jgi:hypothetical protein
MNKRNFTHVLIVLPVLAFAAFLSSSTLAQAACNAECKANDAIWKTRKAIEVNGKSYSVAVAPDRSFVLVAWKKGTKTTSLAEIELVGSSATGCIARDESILSSLRGDPATPIATKVFSKFKYLKLELDC